MRFSNSLKFSSTVSVLVVLVSVINHSQWVRASPRSIQLTSNSLENPEMINLLQKVIHDTELSKPESLKLHSKGEKNLRKSVATHSLNAKNSKTKMANKKSSLRTDLFRQELSKESKDNCLAQLLCGPGYYLPPSNPIQIQNDNSTNGLINGYASLVKEFLDIFSDDPVDDVKQEIKPPKNKKDNKVKEESEEDDEHDDDETARSGEQFVNITGSVVSESEELITTSSTSTVTSVTTGATITELHPVTFSTTLSSVNPNKNDILAEDLEAPKITLEEIVNKDDTARRKDLRGRGSRQMQIPLSFGKLKQSKYINRKIREMRTAKTELEKLQIAGKIASKLRAPRQCRDFQNIASQVLSTCPLTAEVVRYFNSNLKNGSQIALLKQSHNATQGGLVVLNDRAGVPHPYFLDNSPIVANTQINTDLKNPSVGDRFPIEDIRHPVYENAYPQTFNTKIVSLANEPKKPPKRVEKKTDSDEDEEESDENDEEDDEDDDEQDDDNEDDEHGRNDGADVRKKAEHHSYTVQKKFGIKLRTNVKSQTEKAPKAPPPRPQLPKGIIKVYGVPQPSFDNEFAKISSQIGTGPVHLFDQDDEEPGTVLQTPRPRPRSKPVAPTRNLKTSRKTTPKPNSSQASNSEEEEENFVVERRPPQKRHQPQPNPAYRRPHNFATTPSYGGFPAPRPEEYYHNGRPLRRRPRPPTPFNKMEMPMAYNPKVGGRLNFLHSPGAALMRPPVSYRGHYRRFEDAF